MTEGASTVLREALALPADERARVAAELIASLDEERADHQEVASVWARELERRARHALCNPGSVDDWETARDRIAARLHAG